MAAGPSESPPLAYRHKHIPTCPTSHPDNPIPSEPTARQPFLDMAPRQRVQFSNASPRSSGESLATSAETSDSDAPSTPLTEPQEMNLDDLRDKLPELSERSGSPDRSRKRRASTVYASNPIELRRLLRDGSGDNNKFLQKYCCGEGCCMIESLPPDVEDGDESQLVPQPDNDAYRFFAPKLGPLTMDTVLTKIVELPEQHASFGTIRQQSIAEKFPQEAHGHDRAAVDNRPPGYMKPHPPYDVFQAPIYGARELTKPGAEKRTYHFDIDVTEYPEEGGVDFKVGGAVGVCPPNDPAVVEDIMDHMGMPKFIRDKPVRLLTDGGRWPTIWGDEAPRELLTTRREILTWTVDVSSTPPTKPLFRILAEHTSAANEKKILTFLASAQGQAAFCDLRTGPHITLQHLLHAFPSCHPPLEALLPVLTTLMPRFYSLSNDPHVSSAREGLAGRRLIEIAVTIHESPSHTASKRTGVGSGFLERLAHKFLAAEKASAAHSNPTAPGVAGRALNLHIPMFRGLMSNPLSREFMSDGPMMLIGAGVGMAPFRGFILNRLKNANCANKIWLVQGVRDSLLDEIYQGELGAHESEIKRVVQSRAPPPPSQTPAETETEIDVGLEAERGMDSEARSQRKVAKYVQDEVRMQADIVWFVINAVDGRIFVCGSTKGMGEGVESALIDVAMDKGTLDYDTAREFWEQKKRGGQYIAETW